MVAAGCAYGKEENVSRSVEDRRQDASLLGETTRGLTDKPKRCKRDDCDPPVLYGQ